MRTWLHAEDTARAIITIINAGVVNEIYNISGAHQTENINVVKQILELHGIKDDLDKYVEPLTRQGQDVRYAVDDTKLKNLGWKPKAKFDKELKNIVKYYKNNFIW